MKDAEMLNLYARTLANTKDERMKQEIAGVLEEIVGNLRNVGFTHYNREEMLIFPYIERRGLTAIATVLWTKHDEIRVMIKQLAELLRKKSEMPWDEFVERFKDKASEAVFALSEWYLERTISFTRHLKPCSAMESGRLFANRERKSVTIK